jgi:peptide/nickel transport system ATP-binding protein
MDPDMRDINAEKRALLTDEYQREYSKYYGEKGRVYDLKSISDTHFVAMP